jgi:galactofuranose transport system permease protein
MSGKSAAVASTAGRAPRWRNPAALSLAATVSLFIAMSLAGGALYDGFLAPQVFLNLLIDNGFLLVVAVGMTFVILAGGIDLSVGAVVAFTTVLLASLVEHRGWHPLPAMLVVLALGTAFGAAMGLMIERYRLPPFVVTLAGMFLARGAATLISVESIGITHGFQTALAALRVPVFPGASLSAGAVVALLVAAAAVVLARGTQFGRTVYAIGGNEQSAALMGLPVSSTQVGVYALSGFCAALGGVLYSVYTLSGYSLHATGLELDAIAAVVIGGTLLSGGSGGVLGTLFGVLLLGQIQTLIAFDGSLSSWWTRIIVGALLLAFCLLQRLLTRPSASASPAVS